jgi:hypothetical protein
LSSEIELGLESGNLCFEAVDFIVGLGKLFSGVVEAQGEFLYRFRYWFSIGLRF